LVWVGPNELKENYKILRSVFWREPTETYPIDFKEGELNFNLDGIEIKTFKVAHSPNYKSVGIIIEYKGEKLVYPGDVGSRESMSDLRKYAHGADLLIIEAGYPTPTPSHFTLEQIAQVVEGNEVKKVLVTHIGPKNAENIEKFCKKRDDFVMGKDGSEIIL
jgi:ribonuclease BN (tRNA processing enzyme)